MKVLSAGTLSALLTSVLGLVSGVFSPTAVGEGITLHAAVLPSEAPHFVYSATRPRSQAFYATVINDSDVLLQNCRVEMANDLPFVLDYQATERVQNRLVGRANSPVAIAARGAQTFRILLRLDRDEFVAQQKSGFRFVCNGAAPAAVVDNINTVLLSAGTPPTPALLSAIAVPGGTGVLELDTHAQGSPCRFNPYPGAASVPCGVGAYAFALLNGGQEALELEIVDDSGMQFSQLCQTDATAQCVATAAPRVPFRMTLAAQEVATFSAYLVSVNDFSFNPFAEFQRASFFVREASESGNGPLLTRQEVQVVAPPFEWSARREQVAGNIQLSVSGSLWVSDGCSGGLLQQRFDADLPVDELHLELSQASQVTPGLGCHQAINKQPVSYVSSSAVDGLNWVVVHGLGHNIRLAL